MPSFLQNIVVVLQIFHIFCADLPTWQEKYHYQATKTHLTSGIIETIEYWRTNDTSRKDTYHGAAKIIIKHGEDSYGAKYEIHPETTEDYTNKRVCTVTKGEEDDEIELKEELLPDVDDTYTHIGSDTLEIGVVQKFKSVDDDSLNRVVTTLWAKNENSTWVPGRVEILKFGKFRENLQKHVVIDIINYNTNFNEDVFKTDAYTCKEAEPEYNAVVEDNAESNADEKVYEENIFTEFLANQKMQYNDQLEGKIRRKIFEKNMRRIIAHNNRKSSYKLGVTKFIDRTSREMDGMLSLIPSSAEPGTIPFPHDPTTLNKMKFPKQFDLRLNGWITPVQDQLECKAGWAMSVAGVVAAAHAAKTEGPLLRLSSQAILDCAWGYKGRGCTGGSDVSGYQWAQKKGIPTDLVYGPYVNQNGLCATKKLNETVKIQGYTAIPPQSVDGIKYALINHGPVTTSIAVPYDLRLYTGGIFYSEDCDRDARDGDLELTHMVTVVGYGRHLGENYWIIKNSWGKDWGVDGYFFMSMINNNCGVTTRPMYPVV